MCKGVKLYKENETWLDNLTVLEKGQKPINELGVNECHDMFISKNSNKIYDMRYADKPLDTKPYLAFHTDCFEFLKKYQMKMK